jgi:uncharacterized integral membrane protein
MGQRAAQTRRWLRLVILGAVAVYAILFIAFNTRHAKIDFVFGATHVSLIFLVLLALAVGFALGYFTSQLRRHRQHSR